ncbi:hypothetical protein GEV33_011983 [Tenebrio molitor]|uniref:Uncharacterized protein n=1 Tax=Tenebrio molitor TaxID=7067 RepID=A0A8J6HA59_TENMO|nr:hypothetical protein GEV33_011983 [Tenebrio molitor]
MDTPKTEPNGLSRDDGKRPYGMTLVPWIKGQPLVWDVTIVDTLANSYVLKTSEVSGFAAEMICKRKRSKYSSIIFKGLAFESFGLWCKEAINFINVTGNRLIAESGIDTMAPYLTIDLTVQIIQKCYHQVISTPDKYTTFTEYRKCMHCTTPVAHNRQGDHTASVFLKESFRPVVLLWSYIRIYVRLVLTDSNTMASPILHLTPLDFNFWDHTKDLVYEVEINTGGQLQKRVTDAANQIRIDTMAPYLTIDLIVQIIQKCYLQVTSTPDKYTTFTGYLPWDFSENILKDKTASISWKVECKVEFHFKNLLYHPGLDRHEAVDVGDFLGPTMDDEIRAWNSHPGVWLSANLPSGIRKSAPRHLGLDFLDSSSSLTLFGLAPACVLRIATAKATYDETEVFHQGVRETLRPRSHVMKRSCRRDKGPPTSGSFGRPPFFIATWLNCPRDYMPNFDQTPVPPPLTLTLKIDSPNGFRQVAPTELELKKNGLVQRISTVRPD